MPGAELQLAVKGQMDEFLTINPQVSFYQYVYKRHTNFALESKISYFKKNPTMDPNIQKQEYTCDINYIGDLLTDLYFCFTLPDIYSSDKYKFRWVKNVGTVFINEAVITIGSTIIDRTTGEWMNIWNELSLPVGDTKYDTLIGNAPEMQDPKSNVSRISIKNNRFIYFYYPAADKNVDTKPSIASRQIIIPLKFWFTKNPALSLPLFRFSNYTISVKITLESSEMLYQVFSDKLNMYVSPTYYNMIHNENINIYTFTKTESFDIFPYIETNYVFLDISELEALINRSSLLYLTEQLTIINRSSIGNVEKLRLLISNPTEEFVWVIKRNDLWRFNDHFNFSPDIPESKTNILSSVLIQFNNNNRVEEKNAEYFNMIQPYQHHTKIPKAGIYCYSYALYPEKEMLSGYYNAGLVTTNLTITMKEGLDNNYINAKLTKAGLQPYNIGYDVTVYCINLNLFEVMGGTGGMKFTSST